MLTPIYYIYQSYLLSKISGLPGSLLPLDLSVLVHDELLHLGEDGVRLVARVLLVLAQDELHALSRRGNCNDVSQISLCLSNGYFYL